MIGSVLQKVTKGLPDLEGVNLSGPRHWHLASEQDVPAFTFLFKLEAVPVQGAIRGDVEHCPIFSGVEGCPLYLSHFRLKKGDNVSLAGLMYANIPEH